MTSIAGKPLFVSATPEEAAYLPPSAPLLITGISTIPCAVALTRELTQASVEDRLPSRIVNIGTAGALKDGFAGVFEISHVIKHDFTSDLIEAMVSRPVRNLRRVRTFTQLPVAGLATGDAFVSDSATRERLALKADLVDMEGHVVVTVAEEFGVPVTLLKQVSDSADESAPTTWFEAVDRGAQELAEAVANLQRLN